MVESFQRSGGALIATLDSLKEGVTLHKARLVVMHDLHWVPSNVLQAEKRVHRIGQHRPVISTWVTVTDSIDTLLSRALIRKSQAMQDTLGIAAAVNMVDELNLHDVAGESFEDEFSAVIRAWRNL